MHPWHGGSQQYFGLPCFNGPLLLQAAVGRRPPACRVKKLRKIPVFDRSCLVVMPVRPGEAGGESAGVIWLERVVGERAGELLSSIPFLVASV